MGTKKEVLNMNSKTNLLHQNLAKLDFDGEKH